MEVIQRQLKCIKKSDVVYRCDESSNQYLSPAATEDSKLFRGSLSLDDFAIAR